MVSLDSLILPLQEYLKSIPVSDAWVFGSFARGEQTNNSDIDLLVTYEENYRPGLLGIVKIINDLEQILGLKVDLVEEGKLFPRVAKEIESQKIKIYERKNS